MYIQLLYHFYLTDEKLKLKNMFRDPDKVVDLLANKYSVMSQKMAEYLMESSINPVAVSITY